VALLNKDDIAHAACAGVISTLMKPLMAFFEIRRSKRFA
jgi:hypothetical protein